MPWVRLDENCMDHPKFIAISANAWRLWCEGTAYCQKHLTDGLIPRTALKGLRYYSPSSMKLLTATLVPGKGPLWHVLDGGDIHIHDYLVHNEDRQTVLEKRAAAKERMRSKRSRERRSEHASERTEKFACGVACDPPQAFESARTEKGSGEKPSHPVGRGIGHGALAGYLPANHRGCHGSFCERICVSAKQHALFVARFGGAPDVAERELDAFYAQVRARLDPNVPIGDKPWDFWDAQFRARYGTVAGANPKTAGNLAAAARFVARGGGQ